MLIFNLLLRNVWRHKGRALLTLLGLVVAILAFGLLSTVVGAWYAGAEGSSNARLITRNSISLVFPLPLSHAERIRQTDGVQQISWANWFGAISRQLGVSGARHLRWTRPLNRCGADVFSLGISQ